MKYAILLVLLSSCTRERPEQKIRVQGMVVRPPQDTTYYELTAFWRHCDDGRSVLVQAASPTGSGMLIQLASEDSISIGTYPIVWPGDTASSRQRGAMVGVRYLQRDAPTVFALDSGQLELTRAGPALSGRVVGKGVDNAIRLFVSAEFRDVLFRQDTARCRYQP